MNIQYDHIQPVARGGHATVENIRLRCAAHNRYEAERTFGAHFMRHRREERRPGTSAPRRAASAPVTPAPEEGTAVPESDARLRDVISCLRHLGYQAGEARDAASKCGAPPEATTETHVKLALACFRPRVVRPND